MRTTSTAPASAAPTSSVGTTTSTAIEPSAGSDAFATTRDGALGSGTCAGKLDMGLFVMRYRLHRQSRQRLRIATTAIFLRKDVHGRIARHAPFRRLCKRWPIHRRACTQGQKSRTFLAWRL